jgi:hypothetical protein
MEILSLIILTALVWFWMDSMRARELAMRRCTSLCQELDVQFLDHTVRLARLRLGRNERGLVELRRIYVFDFSTDGKDRWYGVLVLLGQRIQYTRMEHPDGAVVNDFVQ